MISRSRRIATEIRAAWKTAIADLDPGDRRFRALNEAAEVLLDKDRRAAYDASLEPEADVVYGYSLYNILGYGIVSRTCSRPQIHATERSIPMPKPPCGTDP